MLAEGFTVYTEYGAAVGAEGDAQSNRVGVIQIRNFKEPMPRRGAEFDRECRFVESPHLRQARVVKERIPVVSPGSDDPREELRAPLTSHMRRPDGSWRLTGRLALLLMVVSVCPKAYAIPSFSRQTGLVCNACHSNPPELTAFGRKFKLEGYTLTDKKPDATIEDEDLKIGRSLPISAMLLLSATATNRPLPDAQNGSVEFPQAFSIFLAGEMAHHLGGMVQATYSHQSDHFSLDNTDIRYADHTTLGSKDLLYGLTLNNGPTVEDVWNSTPSWGLPGLTCPPGKEVSEAAVGEQQYQVRLIDRQQDEIQDFNAVADATVRCLLRAVPAAVPGITFLSGGQSSELASARLNAMNVRFKSQLPWALAFSFARAIQQPALEIWQGKEANVLAAQNALIHRVKCNRAARRGEYTAAMERDMSVTKKDPATH